MYKKKQKKNKKTPESSTFSFPLFARVRFVSTMILMFRQSLWLWLEHHLVTFHHGWFLCGKRYLLCNFNKDNLVSFRYLWATPGRSTILFLSPSVLRILPGPTEAELPRSIQRSGRLWGSNKRSANNRTMQQMARAKKRSETRKKGF